MKLWLINISLEGLILGISMPRTFLDKSPDPLSRTVYEPESKNLDFLKTTSYVYANNSLGLQNLERRTPKSEPTLNSGDFG